DNDAVRLMIEMAYEIENISNTTQQYLPKLIFVSHEQPDVEVLGCRSTDQNSAFHITRDDLSPDEELGTKRFSGNRIYVAPNTKGFIYKIVARYSIMPKDSIDIISFAAPTIGVSVSGEWPTAMTFNVSYFSTPTIASPGHWDFRQLFMPGEHLTVQWERPLPI